MLTLERMISSDRRGTDVWLTSLDSFLFFLFFFHFILSLQQKAIHWEKNLKQSLESDCNGSSVVHTY